MVMAKLAPPIAEKNPFLTNKHIAPAEISRHGQEPITESKYDTDEYEEAEDEQEGSECSEGSAESEYAVDGTVTKEMATLEDTFRKIGMNFRMIARIGEGNSGVINVTPNMIY